MTSYGYATPDTNTLYFKYNAQGNPSAYASYDHKINLLRTHKLWMILTRDYSNAFAKTCIHQPFEVVVKLLFRNEVTNSAEVYIQLRMGI